MNMLESQVGRYVGTTPQITTTLRAVARLARAYSTIQERWCNENFSDGARLALERQEAKLEARILSRVEDLPLPSDPVTDERGTWAVLFEGDPRAHTVKLVPVWPGEDSRTIRESSRAIGADG